MNSTEKWNVYGEWRHMETMGPTQDRIHMLNGILLLQSRTYGKPNVFGWIIRLVYLSIHLKVEFGMNCNLHGSFMDSWLDSPYTYDIYETNDGDSMKVMTQFRSKG